MPRSPPHVPFVRYGGVRVRWQSRPRPPRFCPSSPTDPMFLLAIGCGTRTTRANPNRAACSRWFYTSGVETKFGHSKRFNGSPCLRPNDPPLRHRTPMTGPQKNVRSGIEEFACCRVSDESVDNGAIKEVISVRCCGLGEGKGELA